VAWLAQDQPLLLAAQLPFGKLAPERFWIPVQTNAARRWRPAKFRGHSVSSALPCMSFRIRAVGAAGTLQRGKSPNHYFSSKTRFSTAQLPISRTQPEKNRQHTASLDVLAEPNYYNKHCTHRQPAFLHPTFGVAKRFRCVSGISVFLPDCSANLYTTGFPIHFDGSVPRCAWRGDSKRKRGAWAGSVSAVLA